MVNINKRYKNKEIQLQCDNQIKTTKLKAYQRNENIHFYVFFSFNNHLTSGINYVTNFITCAYLFIYIYRSYHVIDHLLIKKETLMS